MEKKESYGLFTTITMIVGIVIGSGIYFRADDVFTYTNGNLWLALISLSLGAICIIFGSLTLSTLADRCTGSGGLVAYFEEFMNRDMACGYGWFHLFVYSPAITSVVGWAAAIYTFMLFGVDASLLEQVALGLVYNFFFIGLNVLSRKTGGFIQNLATMIKILPLMLIAIYGIFFAEPAVSSVATKTFAEGFAGMGWLAALVPLMYSYDGWTFSLNIAPEVRNAKKNMRKALIIGPISILAIYLLYMFGMYNTLGPDAIVKLGDGAVFEAAKLILGDKLGNIVLVVIIISVLGVVNGLCLASIRLPQAMAEKKMIADNGLSTIDEKKQISFKSAGMFVGLLTAWTIVHYFVMNYSLLGGRDISEISIVFAYVIYILLYWTVFKIAKNEKNTKAMILAVIAILGSLAIFVGSLIASPFYVLLFVTMCSTVTIIGYLYHKKHSKMQEKHMA